MPPRLVPIPVPLPIPVPRFTRRHLLLAGTAVAVGVAAVRVGAARAAGATVNTQALAAAYTRLRQGTLWSATGRCKGYAVLNPGEAAQLDAYVAAIVSGGQPVPPTLATATGQGITGMLAAFLEAADPTPPPAEPPAAANPSGTPMPVGDLPGWRLIFADDFDYDSPSGEGTATAGQAGYFPQTSGGKWGAYPWPWAGTPTWASYFPERTCTTHDSMLDVHLHDEFVTSTRRFLIAALYPQLAGQHIFRSGFRVEMMMRSESFGQYHVSNLLWPQSEAWPRDGEVDWPEADFNAAKTYGFMHRQDGTSGGDQDYVEAPVALSSGWHVWALEWRAGQTCRFELDGQPVGQELTARVPSTPMRFVLQHGGTFATNTPIAGVGGHVFYDWVTLYEPV